MAADGWKEKVDALRQSVDILSSKVSTIKAQKADLKKAYEEELANAQDWNQEVKLLLQARVSEAEKVINELKERENELSALKSVISSLQQKAAGANAQDTNQELKLLQARLQNFNI